MSNTFEAVIGLELHVELKTKTKMFSPALNSFNKAPNTTVNEIDLGYPGALPSVNKKGVELALRLCKALDMKIDDLLRFDRKNYFYSDLSKGFQITQNYHPIGLKGKIDIPLEEGSKTINITRLHIEEDTAKQTHIGKARLIDYNRAGSPLIEIVTEPDIRTAYEAKKFIERLREILLYSEVSDAKMEEGSLRCDVNISIRPIGTSEFGTKVEVKNINSISNVGKAIEYEMQRQEKALLLGQEVKQQTRRFDDKDNTTVYMRSKSDAVEYRYISESNIRPIRLDKKWIKAICDHIPELPAAKRKKYAELGLGADRIEFLIANRELSILFEETIKHTEYFDDVYNWLSGPLLSHLNSFHNHNVIPQELAKMISMIKSGDMNSSQAKKVFDFMLNNSGDPEVIIKKLGLVQIKDENVLREIINAIIDKMPKMLEQYQDRPERVQKTYMGLLMKETKGQANPVVAMKIIIEEITKRI